MQTGQSNTASSGPKGVSPTSGSEFPLGSVGAIKVTRVIRANWQEQVRVSVGSSSVFCSEADVDDLVTLLRRAL